MDASQPENGGQKVRNRQRKLTKMQQNVLGQVISVIPATIAKLENYDQANRLESHIFQMRQGGLISDQQYQIYLNDIKQKIMQNGWEQPAN
jgi:hypothetical protein